MCLLPQKVRIFHLYRRLQHQNLICYGSVSMEIGLIFQNDSEILGSYVKSKTNLIFLCRSITLDPVCFESGHHCHLSKNTILMRQQLYSAIHNVKIYVHVAGYPEKFSDFLSSNLHQWSFPVPWNFFGLMRMWSDVVDIWDKPVRTLFFCFGHHKVSKY